MEGVGRASRRDEIWNGGTMADTLKSLTKGFWHGMMKILPMAAFVRGYKSVGKGRALLILELSWGGKGEVPLPDCEEHLRASQGKSKPMDAKLGLSGNS